MTFKEILAEVIDWLQQDQRITYRALKRQFDLDDAYLEDLKDNLLFAHPVVEEDGRGLAWTDNRTDQERGKAPESKDQIRYETLLPAVIGLLRGDRRVTYRTLKRVFGMDETLLAEICEELRLRRLAIDEAGKVLVWTGETPQSPTDSPALGDALVTSSHDEPPTAPQPVRSAPEAERRQLTVMFCDLVGSTDLSGRLDPEDLREVVRAYQETAATVITRYEGHIAQYLGDGLLIYFGYPIAHEDDAHRAVHTGLGIVEAMSTLNIRLKADHSIDLAIRIGIHTGPVVVGEMGGGDRHENLALGETPNIAARLEGLAAPNTVVISPVTARLVQQAFALEALGPYELKGLLEPMAIAQVVGVIEAEVTGPAMQGFGSLVGRDEEIGLLLRRWVQAKEGLGQVVLLSGEAGIGKSSLVEGLHSHVRQEGYTRLAFRCSPYHTNSALYPVIGTIQRMFGWQPDDDGEVKLIKLEQAIAGTRLAKDEAVPILASLLSLELPEACYPALVLSPQQQRQRTQDTLVAWLQEAAERQPILVVWEDLHWGDPSTVELLGLFVDQAPTASLLHLLTFRPEFELPWPTRSHMTPMTLNRLERSQVEALITQIADGKTIPAEVVEHVVAKTDGVPLFVEELIKMLMSSELLREEPEHYVLTGPIATVAIPDTLQDSLMARLDQLSTAKEIAQLGAVLGREFEYDLIQAVSSQDPERLLENLGQLVEAELLYQRGRPPRSRYLFKHALIQDAAYQSLLRRTRQDYHQHIAQALKEQFPETAETQPELLAYHYAEAGQDEDAIHFWQLAGQYALQNSAHAEAIRHLEQGLNLLKTLPESVKHLQQELDFQIALGTALTPIRGSASSDIESVYGRALKLCQQIGNTTRIFPVMRGLIVYHTNRGDVQTAIHLGKQMLNLAQVEQDPACLMLAHAQIGNVLYTGAQLVDAYAHHKQVLEIHRTQKPLDWSAIDGWPPNVTAHYFLAIELWPLGYPDQALQHSQTALRLAQGVPNISILSVAKYFASILYQWRREIQAAQNQSKALMALTKEQGFALRLAQAQAIYGWTLAKQGHDTQGTTEIRQALTAARATGDRAFTPYILGLMAEAYWAIGHPDEGLSVLAEVPVVLETTQARWYEAELHRLKGVILLSQTVPDESQAEESFEKALDIARNQQWKSWELRAATSLAKLWQSQGKRLEAYNLLSSVYNWFTEGFDTADLIDAKTLLDELDET